MVTQYRKIDSYFGMVSTSRYINIATNAVTTIELTSGNQALGIYNHGTGNLVWGGSSIEVNSGNYLFVDSRIEWSNLADGWNTAVIADSVSTIITVTEYRR